MREKRHFYLLALSLIPRLKPGDEFLLHDLIASCLFNLNFWSGYLTNENSTHSNFDSPNSLIKHLAALKLNEQQTQDDESSTIRMDPSSLRSMEVTHIYDRLSQIKLAYLTDECLLKRRSVDHSRQLNEGTAGNGPPKTLFISVRNSIRPILPVDWMFMPVIRAVEAVELEKKSNLLNKVAFRFTNKKIS